MRITAGVLLVVCLSTAATAQSSDPVEYTIASTSATGGGCIGPSPCSCPSFITLMSARGRLIFTPVLPPLGPLFDYTISGELALGLVSDDIDFTVTGNYTFDSVLMEHNADLTLMNPTYTGPTLYATDGFSGIATSFPDSIQLSVFAPNGPCTFSGIYLTLDRTPDFLRGDVDGDFSIQLSDVIALLQALFLGADPACARAGDFDDDGQLELADVIDTLGYLFTTFAPPAAPYPNCGQDTTLDDIPCTMGSDPCP